MRGVWLSVVLAALFAFGCAHTGKSVLPLDEQLELAGLYEARGDMDSAEKAYLGAIEAYGDTAEAYFGLGNVYLSKEMYREAELNYVKAIGLNPSRGPYYNNLAWLYLETGRLDKAEKEIRKAIAKDPARRYVYLDTLGSVLIAKDRTKEAESVLLEAAAIAPSSEKAGLKHIYTHLLELYDRTGDRDKAEKVRDKIEELGLR